jgi:alkylation response protein AidB-like acyl-CoA dehydrogenase
MDFGFKEEEEKIIQEVRMFLENEVTPELVEESLDLGLIYGGQEGRRFVKKLAAKGYLTPNWPKEYGGLETPEMVTYMIRDELAYAMVPTIFIGAHMAGPTILRIGSEEMKKEYLPSISRGEIEFALGYTEPDAGSDLAAINMHAEEMGDHFLINGQKTFNTHCHVAEYHWLAARTDLSAPKHKGISLFIVDLKSPGISINPMITMAGWRTNEVFYENVKIPKRNLVGEKNQGFYYVMTALDFERMAPPGSYRRLYEEIIEYAKETVVDKRPLSKNPLIRQKLAELAIELEVCKLLYYQLPYMLDKGVIPNYQSSMEKMFVTEVWQRVASTGMEVLGLYGQLKRESKWAPLRGKVGFFYRSSVVETLYGGTSEIMRNIIATRGLNLPRK